MASTILEQILENVRRGAKLPASSPGFDKPELTDESERILQKLAEEVDRRLSRWAEQIVQHPALNSRRALQPIPIEETRSKPGPDVKSAKLPEAIDRSRTPLLSEKESRVESSTGQPERSTREAKTEEIDTHDRSDVSVSAPAPPSLPALKPSNDDGNSDSNSGSASRDTESITESIELSIGARGPQNEASELLDSDPTQPVVARDVNAHPTIDSCSAELNPSPVSSTDSSSIDLGEKDSGKRSRPSPTIDMLREPLSGKLAPAPRGDEVSRPPALEQEPAKGHCAAPTAGITSWESEMFADHLDTDEAPSPIGEGVNEGVHGTTADSVLPAPTEEAFCSREADLDLPSAPPEKQTEVEQIDSEIFESSSQPKSNLQQGKQVEDLSPNENPMIATRLEDQSSETPDPAPAESVVNVDQHLESLSSESTPEEDSIHPLQNASSTGVQVDSIVEEIAASCQRRTESENSPTNSDPANAALEEIRDLLTPLADVPALLQSRDEPQKEVLKQMETLAQEMRDLARRSSAATAPNPAKSAGQAEQTEVQRRVAIDDIQGMIESLS